jgi:hypothetical protein
LFRKLICVMAIIYNTCLSIINSVLTTKYLVPSVRKNSHRPQLAAFFSHKNNLMMFYFRILHGFLHFNASNTPNKICQISFRMCIFFRNRWPINKYRPDAKIPNVTTNTRTLSLISRMQDRTLTLYTNYLVNYLRPNYLATVVNQTKNKDICKDRISVINKDRHHSSLVNGLAFHQNKSRHGGQYYVHHATKILRSNINMGTYTRRTYFSATYIEIHYSKDSRSAYHFNLKSGGQCYCHQINYLQLKETVISRYKTLYLPNTKIHYVKNHL